MNYKDLAADLRGRINPAYAPQSGTESYERRLCAEAIEAQADEIKRLQRTVDLKVATLQQVQADRDCLRDFVRDLLHPEAYGHTVTAEVRDAARRVLGIPTSETKPATSESFNDGAAWRDAISTPRKA